MNKYPWFPFFAADFISGTVDMSPEEVGAYIRLLCHQFEKGKIPADEKKLCRIAGFLSLEEWGIVREAVIEKFQLIDGFYVNMRMRHEVGEAEKRQNASRENGKKGGRPKGKKTQEKPKRNLEGTQREPRRNPDHNLNPNLDRTQKEPRGKAKQKLPQSQSQVQVQRQKQPPPQPSGSADGSECGGGGGDSAEMGFADSDPAPVTPTRTEVLSLVGSVSYPLSQECAETYFDNREAVGWMRKGNLPIADFRADLRLFAKSWEDNRRNGNSRNEGQLQRPKLFNEEGY